MKKTGAQIIMEVLLEQGAVSYTHLTPSHLSLGEQRRPSAPCSHSPFPRRDPCRRQDVYKRQVLAHGGHAEHQPTAGGNLIAYHIAKAVDDRQHDHIKPVSYTHLDVYKRQALG